MITTYADIFGSGKAGVDTLGTLYLSGPRFGAHPATTLETRPWETSRDRGTSAELGSTGARQTRRWSLKLFSSSDQEERPELEIVHRLPETERRHEARCLIVTQGR